MKIAICDDNQTEISAILHLISKYNSQANGAISCTSFHSGFELAEQCAKGRQFDAVFLDVLMPGINGIQLAQEIRTLGNEVPIIFITSSPEYALPSYEVGARYYLLKPVQEQKLFSVLDHLAQQYIPPKSQSILISNNNGLTRVFICEIMYCEVLQRTIFYYLASGKVLQHTGTMQHLQQQLEKFSCFFRPHRSFLINMDYIRSINAKEITMQDSKIIPLPKNQYPLLKNSYMQHIFKK